MKDSKIIMVLGMHRSGTSYVAARLHHMGISMGQRFLDSDWSNPNGHFEDLDFLNLHVSILDLLEMNHLSTGPIQLSDLSRFRDQATDLLTAKSSRNSVWGWKDPRTALFIPFWADLISNPYYFVVFRHYTKTVLSLLKVEYHRKHTFAPFKERMLNRLTIGRSWRQITKMANGFLASWIHHYEKILEATQQSNQCYYYLLDKSNVWSDQDVYRFIDMDLSTVTQPAEFKWSSNPLKDPGFDLNFDPKLEKRAEDLFQNLLKLNQQH